MPALARVADASEGGRRPALRMGRVACAVAAPPLSTAMDSKRVSSRSTTVSGSNERVMGTVSCLRSKRPESAKVCGVGKVKVPSPSGQPKLKPPGV